MKREYIRLRGSKTWHAMNSLNRRTLCNKDCAKGIDAVAKAEELPEPQCLHCAEELEKGR